MTGGQDLEFMQNKTLAQSAENGIGVHLFEVDKDKCYRYQGQVQLVGAPYTEEQPDKNKVNRKVWVFPLRLCSRAAPLPLKEVEFDQAQKTREKKANGLSHAELERRANADPRKAGERQVTSTQHERNPYVSLYAKQRARGICELCAKPAPFSNAKGEPYLETHHIVWLARGGDDTVLIEARIIG